MTDTPPRSDEVRVTFTLTREQADVLDTLAYLERARGRAGITRQIVTERLDTTLAARRART